MQFCTQYHNKSTNINNTLGLQCHTVLSTVGPKYAHGMMAYFKNSGVAVSPRQTEAQIDICASDKLENDLVYKLI